MDRRYFLKAIGGVLAAIGAGQFAPHEWARAASVEAAPVKAYTPEEFMADVTAFTDTTPYDLETLKQTSTQLLGHYHVSTAGQGRANLSVGTWQPNYIHVPKGTWSIADVDHDSPIYLMLTRDIDN